MAYCDYDFYKNEYYGNVVAEVDFPRLAMRASDKLDALTFDRIELVDGVIKVCNSIGNCMTADDKLVKKIKKAVCALAEIIGDIEKAEAASRESIGNVQTESGMRGKVISSVSSGSESISYATVKGDDFLLKNALTDKKAREALFYETAVEYLVGTGLLYAGM